MTTDEGLAVDLVLSLYSSSYQSPPKPEPKVIKVSNGSSQPKRSEPKAEVVIPVVKNNLPGPILVPKHVPLPKPGTLDAAGFFFALKNAGMRRHSETGRLIRHPTLIQTDEKLAIAAYVGYEWGKPFGDQLESARHRARFDLKPEKAKKHCRGFSPTIAGFIAGCPDLFERHIENLRAREQQALDLTLGYERAEVEAQSEHEKLLLRGKALVERERLSVIRQDLISLTVAKAQGK